MYINPIYNHNWRNISTIVLVFSIYVKLKDIKRSLSGKKRPQCVVALGKQPQRKILPCGSYSEGSEGLGLKVTSKV